ncbi:hypothetical protein BAUCODRAFT_71222 [Baudoinia panamericana UAMH 10762]|uniref:Phosphatidylinositol-specific phospholipase C X domain-containing protein n=1 Tax=Baudoinia panamericana (strain UAMH 10762) TaxID=717646 RepID=M2LNL2_BAUPA|nr:uncharacterized protein BAUCODRAFT_71222 [Baudoinia panamericana UAMH 10762]EMC95942.1 hypothetical protein BAUCODRAFT_71222 [Baudoinia panamericana UAMH 10762]
MKSYSDDTLVVHLNLPGAHDADTWNYSLATQQSLAHVTNLVKLTEFDPAAYRCQDSSMLNMLNDGIRVFDLRYAFDVTNTTLVFWHGPGLVSETATVDDVLYGFYRWLDDHPSEAIFLSIQYEGGTIPGASQDAGVQLQLYNALSSPAARHYILQTTGSFGTLGEARGKITLLKRFDLDQILTAYGDSLPGVHFSPAAWIDNSPNITLVYNTATGGAAYIEDYYQPLTPSDSTAEDNIRWKINATEAHLQMAANTHPNSLFWTFASSTNLANNPPITPAIQALGNGSLTPTGGVNERLIPFLRTMMGKRLGIVMFDFYNTPSDLIPLFLSLLPPNASRPQD